MDTPYAIKWSAILVAFALIWTVQVYVGSTIDEIAGGLGMAIAVYKLSEI